jgi:thiol-disulfide isomerase/thioredoxin
MRCALVFLCSLTVLSLAADPPPSTGSPDVSLQVVNYDQLADAVRSQRGKVVVVDAWATYCVPCKREFPNLVRLQQSYGQDGLVCMSVTVDKREQEPAALKFLRAQKATFANYLLNEDPSVWQAKWRINGVPAVFVFDRTGRRAAKFDSDEPHHFTYEDVEKLVKTLLTSAP